jgi:hypothetical protein
MTWPPQSFLDLSGSGRLADLTRTDQDLEERWLPAKGRQDLSDDWALEVHEEKLTVLSD